MHFIVVTFNLLEIISISLKILFNIFVLGFFIISSFLPLLFFCIIIALFIYLFISFFCTIVNIK